MTVRNNVKKQIKITKQQSEIISGRDNVKRVIACAGSGKTFVLTSSIAEILKEKLCLPEEVLAITFSRNAAENMRIKLKERLKNKIDFNEINIFTFNSFGNHIISENSFLLGLGKDYNLINIPKSWQIIYEVVRKTDFKTVKTGKDRRIFIDNILKYIWDLKNNLITPVQLREYINSSENLLAGFKSLALKNEEEVIADYQADLCNVYEQYEQIKNENNLVDYHDHVFLPYRLFIEKPPVREHYSKKYKYIFIDEFQDTDVAQGRLIAMLYQPGVNRMMIVGDDDQGIYSFRGACIENILNFHEWDEFTDESVKDYLLTTNFRSGENIINVIDKIIRANQGRFAKVLYSEFRGKESEVTLFTADSLEEEAESISKKIIELKAQGIRDKDIAILSRTKRFSRITASLKKYNIRYELISSTGFYYEPEILFIISWLMVINNSDNVMHIINILQSAGFNISDRDIFFLRNYDNAGSCFMSDRQAAAKNLIVQIMGCSTNPYLSEEAKNRLFLFLDELRFYKSRSALLKLGELISLIYEHSGLADEFRSGFDRSLKTRIKNVETLVRLGSDFDTQYVSNSLKSFIDYLKDAAKTDDEDPENTGYGNTDSVKVMTIHASKGLEFEAVFLPMLWSSNFTVRQSGKKFRVPSLLRKDRALYAKKPEFKSKEKFNDELKRQYLEEERRIFYVGCSRAKKFLYLSYSNYEENLYKNTKERKRKEPVIFLEEVLKSAEVKNMLAGDIKTEKEKENKKLQLSNSLIKKSEKLLVENIESLDIHALKKDIRLADYIAAFEKMKSGLIDTRAGKHFSEKKFFSLTEVLEYIKCPKKYKWKYVYNLSEPSSKSLQLGEKIHKYIELLTLQKFGSRVKDNYASAAIKPHALQADKMVKIMTDDEDSLIVNCVDNYTNSELYNNNDIEKMIIEQLYYWSISGFILNCKIDRLDFLYNGNFRVIDYKSSDEQSASENKYYIEQLKAYTSGTSSMYNTDCSKIQCCLFFLKNGAVNSYKFSRNEIDEFNNQIISAINKINAGDFNTDKERDSKECRYCSCAGLCNEFN